MRLYLPYITKSAIMDLSLTVSQLSRMAVIGANSAGSPLPSICLLTDRCQQKGASGRPGLAAGMSSAARIAPPGERHTENTHRLHLVALHLETKIARAWSSRLMNYQWMRRLHEQQKWCIDSASGKGRRCTYPMVKPGG